MKRLVIVQCRLGSHRLKEKALLKIDGKPVIEYVLKSMKQVSACDYYLATDYKSEKELKPIAEQNGWKIFAGSEIDVLDRFCSLLHDIEVNDLYNFPDYIIRATADNPFLFADCAEKQCIRYENLCKDKKIDYFTWTDLPHGSGVEIIKTKSLLDSIKYTGNPYDREHVGPALYGNKERFNCVFEKSPKEFHFPNLRTTIDTFQDFFHAKSIVSFCKKKLEVSQIELPIKTPLIIEACHAQSVEFPVLLVPSVDEKHGTGHFRRCLDLAKKCSYDIYLGEKNNELLPIFKDLIDIAIENNELTLEQLVYADIPEEYYKAIVIDDFKTGIEKIKYFEQKGKIITIDDGACKKILDSSSYNINIIPSKINEADINKKCIDFLPVPNFCKKNKVKKFDELKNILIVIGKKDFFAKRIFETLDELLKSKGLKDCNIKIGSDDIQNLRETLFKFDLVITYYGFTAFEAASSNCLVITVPITKLHLQLSKKAGFAILPFSKINTEFLEKLLFNLFDSKDSEIIKKLCKNNLDGVNGNLELANFITKLSKKDFQSCPLCRDFKNSIKDIVVFRDEEKTIRKCGKCGLKYISFLNKNQTEYNKNYFSQEYKAQYGKTYLDDFESIKKTCIKRHKVISKVYKKYNKYKYDKTENTFLDVGCAYGPYLAAGNEFNWTAHGMDVCAEAVDYVKKTLGFSSILCDFQKETSHEILQKFSRKHFCAVTMWYVIEHFEKLDTVLKNVYDLLEKSGVFAFSTPSSVGISALKNSKEFYKNSPSDHFSLWSPKIAKKILKQRGFKVVKIVSTGIHPERFPFVKKYHLEKNKILNVILSLYLKLNKKGDTFEIYCIKK
ncbi:MAG: bifunctional glycosyltransferase/class I SAM-dependent methyltransferase [Treponemataceae bacterium]